MGKTIIHGVKENGLLDAEFKCTAVLVTELINNQHKMSEWEIYKALTEVREAAERDARTAHTYAAALKVKKRRATMGEQLTMISIPKGERTDLIKRRRVFSCCFFHRYLVFCLFGYICINNK